MIKMVSVRKDVVAAIISGFVVGIIAALVVLKLPTLLSKVPSTKASPTPTSTPTPSIAGQSTLTIQEPSDNAIVSNKNVTVKGTASASATVVVFTSENASVAKLSDDGSFTSNIEVTEGTDIITVIKISQDAAESKSVRVYFTPEAL